MAVGQKSHALHVPVSILTHIPAQVGQIPKWKRRSIAGASSQEAVAIHGSAPRHRPLSLEGNHGQLPLLHAAFLLHPETRPHEARQGTGLLGCSPVGGVIHPNLASRCSKWAQSGFIHPGKWRFGCARVKMSSVMRMVLRIGPRG